jgi:transposase
LSKSKKGGAVKEKKYDKKIALLREQGLFNSRATKVTQKLFLENEFFDPCDMIQVKYEMLRWVRSHEGSIKEAAKIFGLSRPAFYQAQASFEQAGLAGLIPQKRGPKNRYKLSREIMAFIQEAMTKNQLKIPTIVHLIKERFGIEIHARSVARAIKAVKNGNQQEKK